MSDELSNRSVALPGTIERDQERLPTPQEALRSVLSTRPLALSILSEARYRVVLTRNSVDAAGRAIRSTRDAELGYEQARRARDPRGLRTAYFWPTAVLVGLLLAAGSAASLALCWRLRLPDRIILTTAAAVLGGAVSWSWSRRHARRVTLGLTLAAAAMCAALMAVHLLLAPSWSILVIAETVAFGAALVAAVLAAELALYRCEGWTCWRSRQASERAGRLRDHLAAVASSDHAAALTAAAAWESLIVEECRLMSPCGADGEQWVADCIDIAKRSAIPG